MLYVSPLKALNYDIERNLRGPLAGLESKLRVGVRTGDTPPKERRELAEGAAGHPDHDAGVALPDAHLAGARVAARGRDADPRRGARGRRHEARRASRALGRAARGARRPADPAHRAVGDAAAARGDRPLRLRRPADQARRRGHAQGARPRGRRPGRGPARARLDRVALASRARRRPGDGRGTEHGAQSIWPSIYPELLRLVEAAPLDDRLRQQPPARRAARAAPERARRAGDRPRAPRLARARAARRSSRRT